MIALLAAVFASLPVVPSSAPPPRGQLPITIAATEKVAAYYVSPGPSYARGEPGYAFLFSDEAAGRSFEQGKHDFAALAPTACFNVAHPMQSAAPGWGLSYESRPTLPFARPESPAYGGVAAVRLERLQDASLDVIEALVDPRTRGARQLAHTTVPLVRIARGPEGFDVYAARDEANVQVVVRQPFARGRRQLFQHLTYSAPGGMMGRSDCGHVRVALPFARGSAAMAVVQTEIALPGDETQDELGLSEVRVRPMRIHLSVSWLSRDPEPVVSVSFGWAGRERAMRM